MNRKLFLIACGMAYSLIGYSQSQKLGPDIISSAGGVIETPSKTIEWTLGELAVTTVNTPSGMYTQGFNQPLILQRLSSNNAVTPISPYSISVFPNPTSTKFTVHVDSKSDSKVYLHLMDISGKQLSLQVSGSLNENVTFDLSNYTSGLYLLRITDTSGILIETFKISKAF